MSCLWPFTYGLGDAGLLDWGLNPENGPPVLAANPRRTLRPEQPGWAGSSFVDIDCTDSDTFTFDLMWLLAPANVNGAAESIANISAFAVVAQDPNGGSDALAASRAIGSPGIDGTAVSQRFGNWLTGTLRYRVQATVTTTRYNTLTCWSFVWVKVPGS